MLLQESRTGRWWIALAILLLLGLPFAIQLLMQRSRPGEAGSTYSQNSRGAAGLLALAKSREQDPVQYRKPLLEPIPGAIAQIWLIQPAEPLRAGEAGFLDRWVAEGGTLILVAKGDRAYTGLSGFGALSFSDPLDRLTGDAEFENVSLATSSAAQLQPLEPWAELGWAIPTLHNTPAVGLPVQNAQQGHPLLHALPPLLAVPFAQGNNWILPVLIRRSSAEDIASPLLPLLTTAEGTIMGERMHGQGRVVVLTTTEWVTNALLAAPACGELAARLLDYRTRPGSTLFLEAPHGYQSQLRGMRELLAASWGRLLIWLGLVVLLAMFSYGIRFVPARPDATTSSPEPVIYAEALGRLYARARAWEVVFYNLAAYFRYQSQRPVDDYSAAPESLERRHRARRLTRLLAERDPASTSPATLQRLLTSTETDSLP